MRILFVVPNVVSFRVFLADLSARLHGAGHDIHVACSPHTLFGHEAPPDPSTTVHPVTFPRGMNPLGHLRAARELSTLVERLQPDVIHAHFSAALFTTALASRSSWPVTLGTYHGMSFPLMPGLKGRILRVAESWTATRFDHVWVLTNDDREALHVSAPAARVSVHRSAGIGCSLGQFHPDRVPATERAELRAHHGLKPDECVFVFVGRFVDFKGFGLTVRAFLKLAPKHPKLRLLLVGSADPIHPTGLTPEEETARKHCAQIVEAGHRSDVWRYLAVSDAMVFPSRREGMPVCTMEAIAMGVPVITSDSRGCRDTVRDGVDGFVLRDATLEAMTTAMTKLATDADLRRRMSAAALAGRERFSRDAYIREQIGIYENQIATNGSIEATGALANTHGH